MQGRTTTSSSPSTCRSSSRAFAPWCAAARRSHPTCCGAGSLSLNTVTHACSVGSESVTLSKREYALLAALMTRPGAILSRRALEEKLYAPGDEPESNAVEYLIPSLRKKIGASAIENIRGLGWRVPADKNAAQ